MAKNTRIKADPYVVGDLARAESALMELATLERNIRAITDGLNEKIDALKDAAKTETDPLEARKKVLINAVGTFLKMNRAEVLKNRKSVELAFGVIGFRSSVAICQMRGVSTEMTLERMKSSGLSEGIRFKEELDKEAVRGWPNERLAVVGLVRQPKNQFFVELKAEKITGGTGE